MEIAGTAQRGRLGVGTTVASWMDLLGAQRWHGHGDHGSGVQLWRSLWDPEGAQS